MIKSKSSKYSSHITFWPIYDLGLDVHDHFLLVNGLKREHLLNLSPDEIFIHRQQRNNPDTLMLPVELEADLIRLDWNNPWELHSPADNLTFVSNSSPELRNQIITIFMDHFYRNSSHPLKLRRPFNPHSVGSVTVRDDEIEINYHLEKHRILNGQPIFGNRSLTNVLTPLQVSQLTHYASIIKSVDYFPFRFDFHIHKGEVFVGDIHELAEEPKIEAPVLTNVPFKTKIVETSGITIQNGRATGNLVNSSVGTNQVRGKIIVLDEPKLSSLREIFASKPAGVIFSHLPNHHMTYLVKRAMIPCIYVRKDNLKLNPRLPVELNATFGLISQIDFEGGKGEQTHP